MAGKVTLTGGESMAENHLTGKRAQHLYSPCIRVGLFTIMTPRDITGTV